MRRWLAGVAIVAVAGGAYLALDGDDQAERTQAAATPERSAPVASRRAAPPPRDSGPRKITYLEPKPWDPTPGVKKWKVEGIPGTFREIVAPDDSPNLEEKLVYKQRRLRFRLTDAAADCYNGSDSKEQIAFAYTMIVEREQLRVENFRVLSSNLSDRAVEECIVGAIKDLRTTAPGIPDATKDVQSTISLHDLWVRNRSVD